VTNLVTNNFLFFKLVSKLVITVTNNFCLLKLVTNETFSGSVIPIDWKNNTCVRNSSVSLNHIDRNEKVEHYIRIKHNVK